MAETPTSGEWVVVVLTLMAVALVVWDSVRDLRRTACKFCGSPDICPDCRRCRDESCNAGCVMCRRDLRVGPFVWKRGQ